MYKFNNGESVKLRGRKRLTTNDIGRLFWRVRQDGEFSEYRILDVNDGEARVMFVILNCIDCDNDWKIKNQNEIIGFRSFQDFSLNTIRDNNFYNCFKTAKRKSRVNYYNHVNPHGRYVVDKFFDDMLDGVVSGLLDKNTADNLASNLNSDREVYTTYRIRGISKGPSKCPKRSALLFSSNSVKKTCNQGHAIIIDHAIGINEGDTCNRGVCLGVMVKKNNYSCSCHISPPCSHCTSGVICNVCDFETEDA
tara:strand:+ start:2318 stop:3070 length:753 start_codon:yes stop_codon:yes gene_type:complete